MTSEDRIQALEKRVDELADRLGRAEDELAIRRLQHAYGYFMDKCKYEEVVDLFSERGQTYFLGGIFKGKAGVRRLYCGRLGEKFGQGKNAPMRGLLLDHLTLQDVITVAPDGMSAKGRFRTFMQGGSHEIRRPQLQRLLLRALRDRLGTHEARLRRPRFLENVSGRTEWPG